MGTDKAALPIRGTTWLAHIARVAAQTGCPVAVIGRARPDAWTDEAVAFLPDDVPDHGPMGGLLTALRYAGGPVLALGCDLPLLDAAALRWLLDEAARWPEALGVAARTAHGPEPLFAVYAAACQPLVEARVAEGALSVKRLLAEPGFVIVPAPEAVRAALHNVNTPEDRRRLGL